MSRHKDDFDTYLRLLGFAAEYRFRGLPGQNRQFKFDWALDDGARKIAVEYDGLGASHHSLKGVWRDQEKTTLACLAGWTVIRCNVKTVRDGRCFQWIEFALDRGGS